MMRAAEPSDDVVELARSAWREVAGGSGSVREVHELSGPGKAIVVRLVGAGRGESNVIGKLCGEWELTHTRVIYEELLPEIPISGLKYYGATQIVGNRGWFFVEEADGDRLAARQPHHQRLASEWLAKLHGLAAQVDASRKLMYSDAREYYHAALQSALAKISAVERSPALCEPMSRLRERLETWESRWSRVFTGFEGVYPTVVHGDFCKKNVRVRAGSGESALLAFDWEYARVTSPAVDLEKVDPLLYGSEVRRFWDIHQDDVDRMVEMGRLFRCVQSIDWTLGYLKYGPVERPLRHLELYGARLDDLEVSSRVGSA
jgi:hypothetical protein